MFVAYFDFYLLLICIMLWLFAANKVVYILVENHVAGWCHIQLDGVMRRLQLRFDFDLTAVRLPIKGHWMHSDITWAADPIAKVTLTYLARS